jgi:hypothetical protein
MSNLDKEIEKAIKMSCKTLGKEDAFEKVIALIERMANEPLTKDQKETSIDAIFKELNKD